VAGCATEVVTLSNARTESPVSVRIPLRRGHHDHLLRGVRGSSAASDCCRAAPCACHAVHQQIKYAAWPGHPDPWSGQDDEMEKPQPYALAAELPRGHALTCMFEPRFFKVCFRSNYVHSPTPKWTQTWTFGGSLNGQPRGGSISQDGLRHVAVGDPDPTSDTDTANGYQTCQFEWADETSPTLILLWSCTRESGHQGQHLAGTGEWVAAVHPQCAPTAPSPDPPT
jgi:hypothetical protein